MRRAGGVPRLWSLREALWPRTAFRRPSRHANDHLNRSNCQCHDSHSPCSGPRPSRFGIAYAGAEIIFSVARAGTEISRSDADENPRRTSSGTRRIVGRFSSGPQTRVPTTASSPKSRFNMTAVSRPVVRMCAQIVDYWDAQQEPIISPMSVTIFDVHFFNLMVGWFKTSRSSTKKNSNPPPELFLNDMRYGEHLLQNLIR
jgi:hypothetical protein